ncbi:MAG TPA: site-specific DNA-methyltransferase [Methanomicrobiales archaeon]|nr:site-specific DNA-methyltransferase [Methanomicrobiales archaeon]
MTDDGEGSSRRYVGEIRLREPYFTLEEPGIAIWNDDLLSADAISPGSVDLIVTSPPYNVDIAYGEWRDGISYADYLEFSREWLKRAHEFAKADGRMCLNIPLDKNKGGNQSVYADILSLAKGAGWKYHSTIVWNEGNISRRTAWGSWMSARAPYIIAPVEVIAILYKERWKKVQPGLSDIGRDEFIEWTNGLWTFPGESRKKVGHPAPFPLELPLRCIKLFSYVGDTVLDPFMGSGTTLVACTRLARRGIGIDIDEQYCNKARDRILEELKRNAPL